MRLGMPKMRGMLPTFVIGLREGVEAALIVSIIAMFLRQEGRTDALRWVWAGVAAAVAICLTVGIVLQLVDQELPQRQQEMLETVIGGLAVGIVTFMLVWMRRHAGGLGAQLRESTATALKQGSVGALVGMAFFAVFREGLETAVFLLAAFQNADDPATAGGGAVLGLITAVVIGVAIYRGGVRLNLQRFFRITGLVLALVAAGLVASTLHTAHEAGWLNVGQEQAFDLSWLVVPGTGPAALRAGMLALQPQPTTIEVIGYVAFAVPAVAYILMPVRRKPAASKVRSAAVATLVLGGAALLLVACGSSDDEGATAAAGGAKRVEVKLTDAGCEPAAMKLDAGPTEFKVTNGGTGRVTEFEVLSGARILGEKENLVAGLSGSFTINLKPGQYSLACPGGKTAATGVLDVGGADVPATGADDPLLKSATASYGSYVEGQAKELVARVEKFVAAIKAGDVAQAKAQFASARVPYET